MCINPVMFRRHSFLGVIPPLWLLNLLQYSSAVRQGKDLMEKFHLGISITNYRSIFTLSILDLDICSHLLQEEASYMMPKQGTEHIYEYSRMSAGIILLLCSFSRILFCFPLGWRSI